MYEQYAERLAKIVVVKQLVKEAAGKWLAPALLGGLGAAGGGVAGYMSGKDEEDDKKTRKRILLGALGGLGVGAGAGGAVNMFAGNPPAGTVNAQRVASGTSPASQMLAKLTAEQQGRAGQSLKDYGLLAAALVNSMGLGKDKLSLAGPLGKLGEGLDFAHPELRNKSLRNMFTSELWGRRGLKDYHNTIVKGEAPTYHGVPKAVADAYYKQVSEKPVSVLTSTMATLPPEYKYEALDSLVHGRPVLPPNAPAKPMNLPNPGGGSAQYISVPENMLPDATQSSIKQYKEMIKKYQTDLEKHEQHVAGLSEGSTIPPYEKGKLGNWLRRWTAYRPSTGAIAKRLGGKDTVLEAAKRMIPEGEKAVANRFSNPWSYKRILGGLGRHGPLAGIAGLQYVPQAWANLQESQRRSNEEAAAIAREVQEQGQP